MTWPVESLQGGESRNDTIPKHISRHRKICQAPKPPNPLPVNNIRMTYELYPIR